MDNAIWQLADAAAGEAITHRRWLHAHPERGFQEVETSAYIVQSLQGLGIKPQTNTGGYGVKVVLSGKRPGRTVAIRADIDALPISEETGMPFASVNPGMMHACGHDVHTAILLGTARALVQMQGDFAGKVVLLFQPAEEVHPGGAREMIAAGVLDDPVVDAAFALHIDPLMPAGHLAFAAGAIMAAPDEFFITVTGKGGHGAYPHQTIDPIPAAAEIVLSLQHVVSRLVSPFAQAVVTVGSIHGGHAHNVIADQVSIIGTIRTNDPQLRADIPRWVARTSEGVAAAHGCSVDAKVLFGYPPVVNDAVMTALARNAAARIVTADAIQELQPSMGGEDFAYFLERVPGCMARLGVAPAEGELYQIHNARLRVDESAIRTGVAYWLALISACETEWQTKQ